MVYNWDRNAEGVGGGCGMKEEDIVPGYVTFKCGKYAN